MREIGIFQRWNLRPEIVVSSHRLRWTEAVPVGGTASTVICSNPVARGYVDARSARVF
jgi:hypothetical protein